jgi:hypothetical protein
MYQAMEIPMSRNLQHVSQIFSISSKYWKERLQNIEEDDNQEERKRRILLYRRMQEHRPEY